MENYCFSSSLWRKDCFLGGLTALLSCLRLTVWPMTPLFYDAGPAFSDPPLPGCEAFLSSWHSSSVCFSLANKSILLLALQKVRQLAGSLSWSTNRGGRSRAGAGCLCVDMTETHTRSGRHCPAAEPSVPERCLPWCAVDIEPGPFGFLPSWRTSAHQLWKL